jgi:hypothetical protein
MPFVGLPSATQHGTRGDLYDFLHGAVYACGGCWQGTPTAIRESFCTDAGTPFAALIIALAGDLSSRPWSPVGPSRTRLAGLSQAPDPE